jgi:predicted nucleic acid-binding protein
MNEAPVITAFLDANVLYPALLRNILMRLASHGLFRARWSARVHEEWIAALLRNRHDLTRARVERTRHLTDVHIQDALVEGYEHRVESLALPDAADRHILAAAIHGGANVIVTMNLRDFPDSAVAGFGIEAMHPDKFVLELLDKSPERGHRRATAAAQVVQKSAAYRRRFLG